MKKIQTKYHVNGSTEKRYKEEGEHIRLGDIRGGTGGHREHDDREHRLLMLIVLKQKSDTHN